MTTSTPLTGHQVQRLLNFRGYGNPEGRFWFVGMEEGGGGVEVLRRRADNFREIEDLAESHRIFPDHDMTRLKTSTWTTMCRIVGWLSGVSGWAETSFVRSYQSEKLGRLGGDTFLTEILPLPKRGITDWPYETLFASREQYEAEVLPERLKMLRDMFLSTRQRPPFVFCYGKGAWRHHRSAFEFVEFMDQMDGEIQIGRWESSIFVLTNFYDPRYGINKAFIDRLCSFIEDSD